MSVTIDFSKLEVPTEIPILQVERPSWDEGSLGELARLHQIDARFEDRGLWHVARSDRSVLEVYAASHSFRLSQVGSESELSYAKESGVPEREAIVRAQEFLAAFHPSLVESRVASVFESVVLVSEEAHQEPVRLVTATQVSFDFVFEGVDLIGPGAKMQVAIRADGEVDSAYRMWRELRPVGVAKTFSADEIAKRLSNSHMFADLTDDTARVAITSARVGVLSVPPTEFQTVLHPAVEVQGTVSTESAELVGFSTYIAAASQRRLPSEKAPARGRAVRPQLITA